MITSAMVQAIVRHLLTAVAGGLFVKYGVDGDTQNAIIGGLTALAGVGWSVYDKKQVAQ